MPTTLGEQYPRTWEGYPPHISQDDLDIWKRYRLFIPADTIWLYFDVGLGGQTEVPEDTPEEMRRMWLRNTQKRIDVLAESVDTWYIIELRHYATASAAGRLLQYQDMWKKTPPDNKNVKLILVSDRLDNDLMALCGSLDIEYKVV